MSVVGTARDGIDALERIRLEPPDLVTLDLEMPRLDGIATLRAIQKFNKENPGKPDVGVLVVSAYTQKGAQATMEALELGAFDFITKPMRGGENENAESFRRQLLVKTGVYALRGGHTTQLNRATIEAGTQAATAPVRRAQRRRLQAVHSDPRWWPILIGVSTGGPKALVSMLPELCRRVENPIVIVQHMPAQFTKSLAERLDRACQHRVTEAEQMERISCRHVYIAPGGRHLVLARDTEGHTLSRLKDSEPINGFKPSVDVLFKSAAAAVGGEAVAVVLTGMGSDGKQGVVELANQGASVIAQDEKSSVVWGMPGSAVATGCVNEVASLSVIPRSIEALLDHSQAPNLNDAVRESASVIR